MDPETVERARRGDPRALDALLVALVPSLLALAGRLAAGPGEAEDLVTEALYRGSVRLKTLRSVGAVEAWFRRILVNLWRDALRRRAPREAFLAEVDEPRASASSDPVLAAEEVELRAGVLRALRALPPGQRAVIALRLDGDLSVSEIAEVLGTTADRVKANLWHARRKLRRLLLSDDNDNDLGDDESDRLRRSDDDGTRTG